MAEQRSQHPAGDDDLATGDGPRGVDELGQGAVLGEVAAGPSLDDLEQHPLVLAVCERKDPAFGSALFDETHRLHSVAGWEIEVENGHVGARQHDLRGELIPVPGVGYDGQILLGSEHDNDRFPEQGVAVRHKNPDGAVRCVHV